MFSAPATAILLGEDGYLAFLSCFLCGNRRRDQLLCSRDRNAVPFLVKAGGQAGTPLSVTRTRRLASRSPQLSRPQLCHARLAFRFFCSRWMDSGIGHLDRRGIPSRPMGQVGFGDVEKPRQASRCPSTTRMVLALVRVGTLVVRCIHQSSACASII